MAKGKKIVYLIATVNKVFILFFPDLRHGFFASNYSRRFLNKLYIEHDAKVIGRPTRIVFFNFYLVLRVSMVQNTFA